MSIFNFFLVVSVTVSSLACGKVVSTQEQKVFELVPSHTPTPKVDGTLRKTTLNPKAREHLYQGLNYKTAGEYEKAIEEFKKSIEAGNNDKEMYRRIAELYISLKRFEDAEVHLRKILEKDSKDAQGHWALAKILVENLGKYDEGLKEAITSKELYGKNSLSYVHDRLIGMAYDGLGDYENAVKHYKIFLKGSSFIPDSDDYKETKKRVEELERVGKKKKE